MLGSKARLITITAWLSCVFFILFAVPGVRAADALLQGQPLHQALDHFRNIGLNLVYSTNLVTDDLLVIEQPASDDPVEQAVEILQPHGLTLNEADGVYLVVRKEPDPRLPVATPHAVTPETGPDTGPIKLENLTVSASRYLLFSNSRFYLDQRAIQALPDLGEDPIRSAQRLPGSAAGGLSSRSHFRGGEHNETAIYLNGLKLLDPFHIRDYHSIFSSIDARAISGVEAFTGGFPANYGDQMSGVLLLDTRQPEKPVHTEIGLSVYNTSLLNLGYSADGKIDWLVSARDSNLDVILNEDLGKPDYFDVFGVLGINLSPDHRLTFNALYSDDQVVVITENVPEELELSTSDTQNTHFWISLENQWTPALSSTTTLSYSGLDNLRDAEANDPDRLTALVYDQRDAEILGFQQNWLYEGIADHSLRWGFGLRHENASYDYRSRAEYNGLYAYYPGITNPTESSIQTAPEGNGYSLFLSDRWRITRATGLELGVRWDRQTYTEPDFGNQFSPRISLLHSFGAATEVRFTWGRYYQSQAIQQLQVEDGLSNFFPPQRANHWIAGIQHLFPRGYRLRVEAYLKDYDRLKPRFENLFDPLVLIPELSPDRVGMAPESARVKGIEFTLEYRGSETLDWWASYTWSRATDLIDGVNERRSWDQRHAIQAGLAWRKGPWEVGLAMGVHSGWPTTGLTVVEEDDIYIPVPGPRNAEQLGTFAQFDFRVSREYPVRFGKLSAFFEVTNLSNRQNECCIDYDIDEDDDGNVFLDVAVEHWLPIIPAVGIFWEF
ncbi:MAG: TonB-dependent receptor [Xanthomonadales bacterium]|nr:TonB-dependent receptor [Gammaproteobacteria bacterium]NND57048.1 TonB-dependent receptor [Xanthomonadales bacterium]